MHVAHGHHPSMRLCGAGLLMITSHVRPDDRRAQENSRHPQPRWCTASRLISRIIIREALRSTRSAALAESSFRCPPRLSPTCAPWFGRGILVPSLPTPGVARAGRARVGRPRGQRFSSPRGYAAVRDDNGRQPGPSRKGNDMIIEATGLTKDPPSPRGSAFSRPSTRWISA